MRTYRELLEVLHSLTDEQLNCDITLYDNSSDEFMAIKLQVEISDTNVLDEGHPVFILNQGGEIV